MSDVKTIITHGGVDYQARVMRIKKTFLGLEDHGIWTFVLHCEGGGIGVGVGTYTLDDVPDKRESGHRRHGAACGMDLLMQVVTVLGVGNWENLVGKAIYVLMDDSWGSAKGIANIDTGKTLIFSEHYEYWKERRG